MAVTAGQVHAEGLRMAHQTLGRVIAEDCSSAQLVHNFGKSHTHILWSIGHLVFAHDVVLGSALGVAPTLSPRQIELFGMGSKPTGNVADYPSVGELKAKLDASVEKLAAIIERLTDEQLAQPLPADHMLTKFFPTLNAFLHIGSFHTGYHAGQVGILRVAQGLPGPFGG